MAEIPTDAKLRERTQKGIDAINDRYVPSSIKPVIAKAAPVLGHIAEIFACVVLPLCLLLYEKAATAYAFMQGYYVDDLAPALLGLVICFYGGTFMTLIAGAEAYRMLGLGPTRRALERLFANAHKAVDASNREDKHRSVQRLYDSGEVEEVLKRKMLIVLRSIDPDEVAAAISAISGGMFAVIATLRVQFAKSIALGNSIGDIVSVPILRFGQPICEELLPSEYRRWARPCLRYTIKAFAILIAWTLQRAVSAIHSALRGGLMFVRGVMMFLAKVKVLPADMAKQEVHKETYVDEVIAVIIAMMGLRFQFSRGFALPFPLNILLLPLTIIEYSLTWIV